MKHGVFWSCIVMLVIFRPTSSALGDDPIDFGAFSDLRASYIKYLRGVGTTHLKVVLSGDWSQMGIQEGDLTKEFETKLIAAGLSITNFDSREAQPTLFVTMQIATSVTENRSARADLAILRVDMVEPSVITRTTKPSISTIWRNEAIIRLPCAKGLPKSSILTLLQQFLDDYLTANPLTSAPGTPH